MREKDGKWEMGNRRNRDDRWEREKWEMRGKLIKKKHLRFYAVATERVENLNG